MTDVDGMPNTDYFASWRWTEDAQRQDYQASNRADQSGQPLPDDELGVVAGNVRTCIMFHQTPYDRRTGSSSFTAARGDGQVTEGMINLYSHKHSLSPQDLNYVMRFLAAIGYLASADDNTVSFLPTK